MEELSSTAACVRTIRATRRVPDRNPIYLRHNQVDRSLCATSEFLGIYGCIRGRSIAAEVIEMEEMRRVDNLEHEFIPWIRKK